MLSPFWHQIPNAWFYFLKFYVEFIIKLIIQHCFGSYKLGIVQTWVLHFRKIWHSQIQKFLGYEKRWNFGISLKYWLQRPNFLFQLSNSFLKAKPCFLKCIFLKTFFIYGATKTLSIAYSCVLKALICSSESTHKSDFTSNIY